MNKLPIFSTIRETYKDTFVNPKRYFLLAILWLGLIGIVAFFGHSIVIELAILTFYKKMGYPSPEYDSISSMVYGYSIIINVLSALIVGTFTCAFIKQKDSMSFDTKLLVFLGKYLTLSILSLVGSAALFNVLFQLLMPILPGLSAIYIPIILSLGLVIYPILRISMYLPDTFSNTPIGFKKSWKIMKGNVIRFAIIIASTLIPTILASSVILLKYTDAGANIDIDFEAIIYDNRYIYVLYIVIINMFSPLQGTLLAKAYNTLKDNA